MTEKIEADFPGEDAYSAASFEEREWDLRIRMVALDQAVAALPHLASGIESEEFKIGTVKRAAAEFEKVLRGENGS